MENIKLSLSLPFCQYKSQEELLKNVSYSKGEVSFSLPLASIPGSFDLIAYYRSSAQNEQKMWNRDCPTSTMGVGWSFYFDTIMKSSADSVNDYGMSDSYYIITPSGLKRIYKTDGDAKAVHYQMEEYFFWDITCYTTKEQDRYWEIVHEDGSIWTYGGENACALGVDWNNWVGATKNLGGTNFPVAWYLKKIKYANGHEVIFDYEQSVARIGGINSTKAVRLKTVTGALGHKIILNYNQKDSFEIDPPHYSKSQDVFQFMYEDKYLSDIDVFSPENEFLYSHIFDYDFYAYEHIENIKSKKRYLVKSSFKTFQGNIIDNVSFDYSLNKDDFGMLTGILLPNKGRVSYQYAKNILDGATCNVDIKAEHKEFTPTIWHGQNQTIITFESPTGNKIELQVCRWAGAWETWNDSDIQKKNIKLIKVYNSSDFFVLHYKDLATNKEYVRLYHENIYKKEEWLIEEFFIDCNSQLAVGAGYIAAQGEKIPDLKIFQWDGASKKWHKQSIGVSTSYEYIALGSGNGFVAAAYSNPGLRQVRIQFFRVDANYKWEKAGYYDVNKEVEWGLTRAWSVWAVSGSCASATFITEVNDTDKIAKAEIFLIKWTSDYKKLFVETRSVSQTFNTKNPILYSVSTESVMGHAQNVFRLDVSVWKDNTLINCRDGYKYIYGYGSDLGMVAEIAENGTQRFFAQRYDPYRASWTTDGAPFSQDLQDREEYFPPQVFGDYAILGNNIFLRNTDESWKRIFSFPSGVKGSSIKLGLNYAIYQKKNINNTYIIFLKNGHVSSEKCFSGEMFLDEENQIALLGMNNIVTYTGESLKRASLIRLRHIHNNNITNNIEVLSLSDMYVSDGMDTSHIKFKYDLKSAVYDSYSSSVSYAGVEIIYPEGGRNHLKFLNRKSAKSLKEGNVKEYYGLLQNVLLEQEGFDQFGNQLSKNKLIYEVFNNGDKKNLYGIFYRVNSVENTTFFKNEPPVIKSTTYEYNSLGQIVTESSTNMGIDGKREKYIINYSYGWEKYPDMKSDHLFTPVIKTEKMNERDNKIQVISAEESIWKKWENNVWNEAEKRRLKDENWITIERVTARSKYGIPIEIFDIDGIPSRVVTDKTGSFVIAEIKGASIEESAYRCFEDYECNCGWYTDKALITNKQSYSGKNSLCINSEGKLSKKLNVKTVFGDGAYQFSSRYKGNMRYVFILEYKNGKTEMFEGTTASVKWNLFWYKIEPKSELASISVEIINDTKEYLFIDSIFFLPLEATATASIYSKYSLLKSIADSIGNETNFIYDNFFNQTLIDEPIKSSSFNLFSMQGDSEHSANTEITARTFFNSAKFIRDDWQEYWFTDGNVQDGILSLNVGDSISPKFWNDNPDSFSLRIKSLKNNFVISFINEKNENYSIQSKDKKFTFGKKSQDVKSDVVDCVLLKVRERMMFFVNGKLLFNELIEVKAESLKFKASNELQVEILAAMTDPITVIKYFDGLGREIQTHEPEGKDVVVSAIFYDASGNNDVVTRKVFLTETAPHFIDSFAVLDRSTWNMKLIDDRCSEDEGRPYFRKVFNPMPDMREVESWLPGKTFSGNHTSKIIYSSNLPQKLLSLGAESGFFTVKINVDRDEVETAEVKDMAGRTVATWTGKKDVPEYFSCMHYDCFGNIEKYEQPNTLDGNYGDMVITTKHDFWGREIERLESDWSEPLYSIYDLAGRLRFRKDTTGRLLYWCYDIYGRTVEEGICDSVWDATTLQVGAQSHDWLPSTGVISKSYTYGKTQYNLNRLESGIVSNSGNNITNIFTHNHKGMVIKRIQQVNTNIQEINFEYDLAGNVLKVGNNITGETEYKYDSKGRCCEVWQNLFKAGSNKKLLIADYKYTPEGLLLAETFDPAVNPFTTNMAYNSAGWLTSSTNKLFSQKMIRNECVHKPLYSGKVAECSEIFNVSIANFTNKLDLKYNYDHLGRLKDVERNGINEFSNMHYDPNGNMEKMERLGNKENYVYQPGTNLLEAIPSLDEVFTWDSEGRLLSSGLRKIKKITYEPVLQTVQKIEKNDNTCIIQGYDVENNRVFKQENNTVVISAAVGKNKLLWRTDLVSGNTQYYIYGVTGLIAIFDGEQLYYIVKDRLGSVRMVINNKHDVVSAYNYDSFGNPQESYEQNKRICPFLFTGVELESTGFYHFHARMYDPLTGRFLAPDPKREFPSPYLYCGCDPINFIDPMGEYSKLGIALGVLMILAGFVVAAVSGGMGLGLAGTIVAGVITGALIGAGSASFGYGLKDDDVPVGKYIGGVLFSALIGGLAGGLTGGFGNIASSITSTTKSIVFDITQNVVISSLASTLDNLAQTGMGISDSSYGAAAASGAINGAVSGLLAFGAGKVSKIMKNSTTIIPVVAISQNGVVEAVTELPMKYLVRAVSVPVIAGAYNGVITGTSKI